MFMRNHDFALEHAVWNLRSVKHPSRQHSHGSTCGKKLNLKNFFCAFGTLG